MRGIDRRIFYQHRQCTVSISIVEDGRLRLSGQDLAGAFGADEYEYFITIGPAQFDAIRAALDAPQDADIVDTMCPNAEQNFMKGESTWLKERGIPFDFSNYF